MGDTPPPSTATAPPESPKANNMALLYYGLAVVGTAAILLVMYNLIVLRWCGYASSGRRERAAPSPSRLEAGGGSSRSFDNSNSALVSSFKYKKEGADGKDVAAASYNEHECAVCLSVFEEDEELKQLPRCKHSFHGPCIDMWLYSHLDCPLCRSPVDPPAFLHRVLITTTPTRMPMPSSREESLNGFAI